MNVADWFRDTRVRNKILAGYGVLLLLFLLLLAVIFIWLGSLQRLSADIERLQDAESAGERVAIAMNERVSAFRQYMLSGQGEALEAADEAATRYHAALDEARSLVENPAQRELLEDFARHAEEWEREVFAPGIELRRQTLVGESTLAEVEAFFVAGPGLRGADRARASIRSFREGQQAIYEEERESALRAMNTIRTIVPLLVLIAVGMAIWVSFRVANRIVAPLDQAVGFSRTIAEGDLTRQIETTTGDEVGVMIGTLNRMAADLRTALRKVAAASGQVASAAEEIAATSEEISTTVDEQVTSTEEASSSIEEIAAQINRVAGSAESLAASVDQTSSSIAQISASIEQTAERADALGATVEQTSTAIEEMFTSIREVGRHVSETEAIARQAEADARTGGKAVERSTLGMQRIHDGMGDLMTVVRELGETSRSVTRMSEVIEDIADQTNLLALNASIEAARAGEHGRGFSVVAQEIRRLAERSVDSAREISSTVAGVRQEIEEVVQSAGGLMERSEQGIDLASEAADELAKIITSAGRTRELMEDVGTATEQQGEAAEQAKQAVVEIMQIADETRIATREQAVSSRQIRDAVENMNHQTQEVFAATTEQRKGGELILQATETISSGARSSQGAIQELVSAAEDLSEQAARLTELVHGFRTDA